MERMNLLLNYLENHKMILFVAVVIIFDLFIGVLRATKDKKINSSVGIDGMIRKVAMIGCLSFLIVIDFFMKVDIIGWLPNQVLEVFEIIGIKTIGISDAFGLLFVVFELISVIKNWTLLGLPMFKGLNNWINNFLEVFTDEMPTTHKNEEIKGEVK